MTPEQFTYWLQGFSELSNAAPTQAQWELIKAHLNLVFNKVTPTLADVDPVHKTEGNKQLPPGHNELQRLLEEAIRRKEPSTLPIFGPQPPLAPLVTTGWPPTWIKNPTIVSPYEIKPNIVC